MTFITWHDALFGIGVKKIDDQHKKILELINILHDSLHRGDGNSEMGEILKELVDYIKYHFSEEEKLMAESSYPDVEAHCVLHVKFTRHVVSVLLRLRNQQEVSIYELLSFLLDWWNEHIVRVDKKIGKYLAARKARISG
ncbi:MAG: bacteriohemerythrin [Candidatus Zixiibacteriota bacterium]